MAAVLLRQQSRDQLWIVIVAKLPLEMTTTGTARDKPDVTCCSVLDGQGRPQLTRPACEE
jgi:hypothetical protein